MKTDNVLNWNNEVDAVSIGAKNGDEFQIDLTGLVLYVTSEGKTPSLF